MDALTVVVGLLVGILVGLTGIGGGVVLIPLLILGLGVPPVYAIGTGAAYSALTKLGAVWQHWRQRTIDVRLALFMALGSIPGAVAGVQVFAWLQRAYGDGANDILRRYLGLLLVAIPALMLLHRRNLKRAVPPLRPLVPKRINRHLGAVAVGVVGGFLVGLTSVGSGTVIIVLLLLFYRLPAPTMVGTDIFHALILTAVTGALHYQLGTVDVPLLVQLLIGSLPGAYVGSLLSTRLPAPVLRSGLALLVAGAGLTML